MKDRIDLVLRETMQLWTALAVGTFVSSFFIDVAKESMFHFLLLVAVFIPPAAWAGSALGGVLHLLICVLERQEFTITWRVKDADEPMSEDDFDREDSDSLGPNWSDTIPRNH